MRIQTIPAQAAKEVVEKITQRVVTEYSAQIYVLKGEVIDGTPTFPAQQQYSDTYIIAGPDYIDLLSTDPSWSAGRPKNIGGHYKPEGKFNDNDLWDAIDMLRARQPV